MAKIQKATSYPGHEKRKTTPIHDKIQIALALTDENSLINLLVNSNPSIVSLSLNESLKKRAFNEALKKTGEYQHWIADEIVLKETVWNHVSCSLEVPILKKNYAVDSIIHCRYDQNFTVSLRHKSNNQKLIKDVSVDNTVRVLVEIKTEIQSWSDTLRQINRYREEFEIWKSILVCDTLTESEAQAFMKQGVSVYSATCLTLPIYADCSICVNGSCPMSGTQNSPVTMCRGFDTIDEWLSDDKRIEGSEEF